ncbi:hypothetical protein VTI74DRAFT_9962 [Chaetomium olivicolor]
MGKGMLISMPYNSRIMPCPNLATASFGHSTFWTWPHRPVDRPCSCLSSLFVTRNSLAVGKTASPSSALSFGHPRACANWARLSFSFSIQEPRCPWDSGQAHRERCTHRRYSCISLSFPAADQISSGRLLILAPEVAPTLEAVRRNKERVLFHVAIHDCSFTDCPARTLRIWISACRWEFQLPDATHTTHLLTQRTLDITFFSLFSMQVDSLQELSPRVGPHA